MLKATIPQLNAKFLERFFSVVYCRSFLSYRQINLFKYLYSLALHEHLSAYLKSAVLEKKKTQDLQTCSE